MTTTQLKGNVSLCEDTSSVLTLNKPITIGYAVPTLTTQLGGSVTSNQSTFLTANMTGTGRVFLRLPSLTAGVYQVNMAGQFTSTDLDYFVNISLIATESVVVWNNGDSPPTYVLKNTTGGYNKGRRTQLTSGNESPVNFSGTATISNGFNTLGIVIIYAQTSTTTTFSGNLTATRIA